MSFTKEALAELKKPLSRDAVSTREGGKGMQLSYLEAHYMIRRANDIFGADGWNRHTIYNKKISETKTKKGLDKVGYEAKVLVTVGDVSREGTGYGSGISHDLFDAIEGAGKEAETDAMKRALMTFGDQFGLALYDKEQKHVTDYDEALLEDVAEIEDLESLGSYYYANKGKGIAGFNTVITERKKQIEKELKKNGTA